MVEDRRFLAEQGQDRRVTGKFGQDDLDGDMVAGLDVMATVDLAHAAECDPLVKFVDAAELRTDGGVGHLRRYSRLVIGAHQPRPSALDRSGWIDCPLRPFPIFTSTMVTLSVPPRA